MSFEDGKIYGRSKLGLFNIDTQDIDLDQCFSDFLRGFLQEYLYFGIKFHIYSCYISIESRPSCVNLQLCQKLLQRLNIESVMINDILQITGPSVLIFIDKIPVMKYFYTEKEIKKFETKILRTLILSQDLC